MANRPIGVAEVALPAGAATSAKQDTISYIATDAALEAMIGLVVSG